MNDHVDMKISRHPLTSLFLFCLAALLTVGVARADLASAQTALDNGEHFEALRAALEDVADRPVDAYTLRAKAYLGLGDRQLALGQFQRALSFSPESPSLNMEIAELLEEMGETHDAVLYYQRSYDLDSRSDETAKKLMELMADMGRVRQQIDFGERALKTVNDPTIKSWIDMRLGHLYYGLRNMEKAREHLKARADQSDAATTTTLYFLAKTYYADKQDEEALKAIDRALEIDSQSPDLLLARADALLRSGNTTEAYDVYWEVKELDGAYWEEIPQKRRLAIARHKKQIPDIIVERYGLLIPLYIFAGVLALLLVGSLIVFMRNKSEDG